MTLSQFLILHQRYPKLYSDRLYFECGPGWIRLLDSLGVALSVSDPGAEASVVKEKFGQLRLYFHGGLTDAGQNSVSYVEMRSGEVCEQCGEPGELRMGSWVRCQCDKCFEEFNRRK